MNKKTTNVLFTIVFVLMSVILYYIIGIAPTYFICDDMFLKQIISGEMLGTPEAHMLHVGYITGCFLKLLYTIFPSIPWYGVLLFSYYCISVGAVFFAFLKIINSNKIKTVFLILFFFTMVTFLWIHMILIQYTTITAILCATSLTLFYLSTDSDKPLGFIKANTVSFFFFFISLELRAEACIMFLPMFFFVGLLKIIKNKKMFSSIATYGSILLCILLFSIIIEKIAYSEFEWNDFQKYNAAREQIIDHNGFPDYEDFSEQYAEHGISHESYQAIVSHYQLLLDENIDTSFMEDMASISYKLQTNIPLLIKQFIEYHTSSYSDRPLNLVVYIVYFFTIILILLSKRFKIFYELLALFAGRMIIWTYLLLVNRPQPRVTQGVYIAELFFLVAILLKNNLLNPSLFRRKAMSYIVTLCFIGCLIFSGVKWGLPYFRGTHYTSTGRIYVYQNYREILDYFNAHEQNLYLLDTNNFSNFLEGIFEKPRPTKHNTVLLGSWTANSPWTNRIAEKYQIESYEEAALTKDNVFFVFVNSEYTGYEYLEQYYKSKYPDSYVSIHDTFKTFMGLEVLILKVDRMQAQ